MRRVFITLPTIASKSPAFGLKAPCVAWDNLDAASAQALRDSEIVVLAHELHRVGLVLRALPLILRSSESYSALEVQGTLNETSVEGFRASVIDRDSDPPPERAEMLTTLSGPRAASCSRRKERAPSCKRVLRTVEEWR